MSCSSPGVDQRDTKKSKVHSDQCDLFFFHNVRVLVRVSSRKAHVFQDESYKLLGSYLPFSRNLMRVQDQSKCSLAVFSHSRFSFYDSFLFIYLY
jgi:hypothetical protein